MAGGGSDRDEGALFASINMTPLVDITLVLLVIFMVAAPLVVSSPAIQMILPRAVTAEATKPSTLVVSLSRRSEGGYKLFGNGHEMEEAGIRALVGGLLKGDPELQAIVAADRGIPYGDVMHVVDLVRALGVSKFALNTEAEAASASGPPVPASSGS